MAALPSPAQAQSSQPEQLSGSPAPEPGSTWSDWFFPYTAEKGAQAEANMLRNHGVTTPYEVRLQGGLHTIHFEAPFQGL